MARVLVVDDSGSDRALIVVALGAAQHEVFEAADGDAALQMAREHRPDLVITDLLLPGMDGYELVRRMRSTPETEAIRAILVSAHYDADELRRFAAHQGVDAVLTKPVRPMALVQQVDACLAGPPPIPSTFDDEGEAEHLRLLSHKLFEKVDELERSNADVRRLLAAVVNAQEAERQRIAHDVHDDSIQVLTASLLRLGALRAQLDDPDQRAALDELEATLASAVERLRNLLFDLRLPSLDAGLGPAIEELLAATCQPSIAITLEDRTTTRSPDRALVAYRIAQEAVANVCRHSKASSVAVTLDRHDDGVLVEVRDDGCGFVMGSSSEPTRSVHLGLVAMRERAELVGGWCRVQSEPGRGTTVEFWLPDHDGSGANV